MNAPFNDNLDDDRLGDALARTLEAMAGQANPAGLHAALPRVRRSVGRRRAAKITGATACALVLVGGIGVGAWAAPWQHTNVPVPAHSSTPTPTPSPTPSPSPTTSPTPTEVPADTTDTTAIDDPHFSPSNMAFWSQEYPVPELDSVLCGDPVTELAALPRTQGLEATMSSAAASVTLLDGNTRGVSARERVTNTGTTTVGQGLRPFTPVSVYVQAGRIVGSGLWSNQYGDPFVDVDGKQWPTIAPGASFEVADQGIGGWTGTSFGWLCGTRHDGKDGVLPSFPDAQPAGMYDVYLLTAVKSDSGTTFLLSDKATVTVPAPLPVVDQPQASACSAQDNGDDVDPDLTGLSQAAADRVTTLLAAVRACDEKALTEATKEPAWAWVKDGTDSALWTLPEEGTKPYATLEALLTRTHRVQEPADGPTVSLWPRVASSDQATNFTPDAWQEIVDAGLITADQATAWQQTPGSYPGFVLAIAPDGTWDYFMRPFS